MILIAAATGVTQMRSIARWLLAQPEAPTVSLFWGTLTPEELYLSNELDSLAASDHRFQYFPVVSQGGSAWSGRKGLVVNAAIEDCEDLSSADIYISGSPTMVYGTLDRLVEEGIDADRVSADVFDYALEIARFRFKAKQRGPSGTEIIPTQRASGAELAPGYENLRSAEAIRSVRFKATASTNNLWQSKRLSIRPAALGRSQDSPLD